MGSHCHGSGPQKTKQKGTRGRWWHQVVARLVTRLERREFLSPLMVARHCVLLGCSLGAGTEALTGGSHLE